MFRKVLDFITGEQVEQHEREAIIDLVNLLCHIDGKVKLTEQDYIDEFIEKLEWDSGTAKETYFSMSLSKVRDAVEGAHVETLIDDIVGRLSDRNYRTQALELADAVANADNAIEENEAALLETLKARLQK